MRVIKTCASASLGTLLCGLGMKNLGIRSCMFLDNAGAFLHPEFSSDTEAEESEACTYHQSHSAGPSLKYPAAQCVKHVQEDNMAQETSDLEYSVERNHALNRLEQINVGIAIINHPPNHHFYGWYKPSNMDGLWHCYTHINFSSVLLDSVAALEDCYSMLMYERSVPRCKHKGKVRAWRFRTDG